MIRLIQGVDRARFGFEIDAMHRIRALTFADRLGWEVKVVDGWEIDEFDSINPLYLLSIDPRSGAVRGSLRLLPTTGPNMLRDVFSVLLDTGEVIESAVVWESSRFSIHPQFTSERSDNRLNRTTGELIAGAIEVGVRAGLSQIVSVFDSRMARILRLAGCPADVIGTPKRIGQVLAYAGLFECTDSALEKIRAASGITGSVLEAETVHAESLQLESAA